MTEHRPFVPGGQILKSNEWRGDVGKENGLCAISVLHSYPGTLGKLINLSSVKKRSGALLWLAGAACGSWGLPVPTPISVPFLRDLLACTISLPFPSLTSQLSASPTSSQAWPATQSPLSSRRIKSTTLDAWIRKVWTARVCLSVEFFQPNIDRKYNILGLQNPQIPRADFSDACIFRRVNCRTQVCAKFGLLGHSGTNGPLVYRRTTIFTVKSLSLWLPPYSCTLPGHR